jgi:hypothetical protein
VFDYFKGDYQSEGTIKKRQRRGRSRQETNIRQRIGRLGVCDCIMRQVDAYRKARPVCELRRAISRATPKI